jgi:hypothetical protein
MPETRRRGPFICVGLLVLGVGLAGLAVWRFTVYWSGPEEAFIRFEPSPLGPEYDRLRDRYEDLHARWQAGDPNVSFDEVEEAWQAHSDKYEELVADHEARWYAAQDVEAAVFLPAGTIGGILILVACGWGIALWLTSDRRRP